MLYFEIMSISVNHSIISNVTDNLIIFLAIKEDLKLLAELATHVDVLLLETCLMHHIRNKAKLKGDIIQRPNKFPLQFFDFRKDIMLIRTLLLGKLFDKTHLLLVKLLQR
jgi:hypothetical protein